VDHLHAPQEAKMRDYQEISKFIEMMRELRKLQRQQSNRNSSLQIKDLQERIDSWLAREEEEYKKFIAWSDQQETIFEASHAKE
jgi:thiamine kinase-like enzyme